MALPLIIITTSWILILAVIASLCLSARRGDLQQLSTAPEEPTNERIEVPAISARITAQSAQPARRVYPCSPFGITGGAKPGARSASRRGEPAFFGPSQRV
jgi:hypothetical protein